MTDREMSAQLKQFLFEYIDSVELIEVLLLLRNNSEKFFSANEISSELRSNPKSISNRLNRLSSIGLLEQKEDHFRFCPTNDELKEIATELSNEYLLRRHHIFELIFSSAKNVRQFANAFIVTKSDKKDKD